MAEITIKGRMTVKELKEVFFNAFEGILRIYKGRSSAPDDATLASISANSNIEGKELVCKDTQTVSEFVEQIKQVLGVGLKVATKDDWVAVLDYIRLSQIKDIPQKATLDYMKTNFPKSAQTKEEKVEKAETTKVEPDPVTPKADKDDLMDMLERYLPTIEKEKDKKSLAEFIARERKQRHFDADSEKSLKEFLNLDYNQVYSNLNILQYLAICKAAKRGNIYAQYRLDYIHRYATDWFCSNQDKLTELEEEKAKLEAEKAKLEASVKELQAKYNQEHSKYNDLVREWNDLVDRKKSLQSKYESLQDDYADLQDKYSSAQSRPSRPSADDIVKVRVMYLKKRTIGWNTRETKIVEMTRRDYKSLSEGSMKNRIAYVNNKFKNSWNIDGLEEVHVELV